MLSTPRFVRWVALAAALATALIAAFPLWDNDASASTGAPAVSDRRGHDRPERHGKRRNDNPVPAGACTLTVPPQPLTAAGLAMPYLLAAADADNGTCHEANPDNAAFVEATILDPATGALSVYRPLVVDEGTEPAAAPVVPTLPAGAVVGVWFGFNGDTLVLKGDGARRCVNGLPKSPFGQFGYCGAPAFFRAANTAKAAGLLTVPPLGVGKDGQPCPTVRDFTVVDQDQSDNVDTVYRLTADGRTAQDNAANAGIGNAFVNGSDNGLLNRKIQPAVGCAPFTAPDLTNGGATQVPSLALNELHAAQQAAPVALIPLNNPMAKVGDRQSLRKVNLYRLGVGQPPALTPAQASGVDYCRNLTTIAPPRLELDKPLTQVATSPEDGVNLFDFLKARYAASLTELGCKAA